MQIESAVIYNMSESFKHCFIYSYSKGKAPTQPPDI